MQPKKPADTLRRFLLLRAIRESKSRFCAYFLGNLRLVFRHFPSVGKIRCITSAENGLQKIAGVLYLYSKCKAIAYIKEFLKRNVQDYYYEMSRLFESEEL